MLLGLTQAALASDGWLAAASFQHTTPVLTAAALAGAVDPLRGLKERVIFGQLVVDDADPAAGTAPSGTADRWRPPPPSATTGSGPALTGTARRPARRDRPRSGGHRPRRRAG